MYWHRQARASEACAIRLCDIDFNVHPVKVHVRKEYAKTRVARDVYISDEATRFLKYRPKRKKIHQRVPHDTDLVFTYHRAITDARAIYDKARYEFAKVLQAVGFAKYKEGMTRRTITLHSFRRYVKTVISDQVSKDYSEWFLGHSKSPYYTMKEPMRHEIYQTKCMKYLTFLDYTALETTGKNIQKQLEQKDERIANLEQQMAEMRHLTMQWREEMMKQMHEYKYNYYLQRAGVEKEKKN